MKQKIVSSLPLLSCESPASVKETLIEKKQKTENVLNGNGFFGDNDNTAKKGVGATSAEVATRAVLRNFAKFTGKHLCQSLFFNKVVGFRPFFTEHLRWLLLFFLMLDALV